MMNSEMGSLIIEYRRNGTAIPAFSYSDWWDLKATITAAGRHPVSVMVAVMRQDASIRVFSYPDHSLDPEFRFSATEAGYDFVMIDGSTQLLQRNIKVVNGVVELAHKKEIMVGPGIGRITSRGIEGFVSEEEYFLTPVGDVVQLAQQTGVDIGTIIHRTYMTALGDTLNGTGDKLYTLDMMSRVLPGIEQTVSSRIRPIGGP